MSKERFRLEELPFFLGYRENGTALIDVEEFQNWLAEEEESAYLLQSDSMRERLLTARSRTGGKALAEVKHALGL